MLRVFVSVFLFVILTQPANAATREERAREMAECGYLAVLAAGSAEGAERTSLVKDAVDFTNLFYAYSDLERPIQGQGITADMLDHVSEAGFAVHARRLTAISEANALRLSNRILTTCRMDLELLIVKLRADAGLPPQK